MAEFYVSGKTYDTAGRVLRNRLNLKQRIDVIKAFKHTPDIGQLAERFQCGRRQIKHILSKRDEYLSMWKPQTLVDRLPLKVSTTMAIEMILREWVERARDYNTSITDDILRTCAQDIARRLNVKDFKISNTAWLSRFREKYNFADIHIKSEPTAVRKSLDIDLIIEDLRRIHGDDAVLPTNEIQPSHYYGNNDYDVDAYRRYDIDVTISDGNEGYFPSESPDSGIQLDSVSTTDTNTCIVKEIETYKEALNQLGPLEQFALLRENIRAVGLINQLENLFRDEMMKSEIQ